MDKIGSIKPSDQPFASTTNTNLGRGLYATKDKRMYSMDFNKFLLWEKTTRDTIDFKKMYVDMCGDLIAGLILSEIVYWYLPSKKTGENKLRVFKDKYQWLAVSRKEWWDRIRLKPRQADIGIAKLIEKGLVEKQIFKFNGNPTVHLRINEKAFIDAWNGLCDAENEPEMPKDEPENEAILQNGNIDITESAISLTETTTETTLKESENEFRTEDKIDYKSLPEIKMFFRVVRRYPSKAQMRPALELIRAGNYSYDELRRGYDAWVAKGWKPTSLEWIKYCRSGIPAYKRPEQAPPPPREVYGLLPDDPRLKENENA